MSPHNPGSPCLRPPLSPACPNSGCTPGGRFARGNPGGPGNPFARRTAAFHVGLDSAGTAERGYRIGRVRVPKEPEGDLAAAGRYCRSCIGRPLPAADPDRLGRQEIDVVSAGPAMLGPLQGAVEAMLPADICGVARATLPATSAARAEQYLECLTTGELPKAVEDEQPEAREEDETWAGKEAEGRCLRCLQKHPRG